MLPRSGSKKLSCPCIGSAMSGQRCGYRPSRRLRSSTAGLERPWRPPEEVLDMTHDDHDTVVVDRGGGGMGPIIGVIVVLLLLVGFWYFAFGPGQGTFSGTSNPNDINVNVDVPTDQPQSS